jgi:hypothetical protein
MHPVRLCSHLAGISTRNAHRIFDEGLLPVGVTGYPRALSPLGCILASFLFGPGPMFTVAARQHIISIIHQRHKDHDSYEALATSKRAWPPAPLLCLAAGAWSKSRLNPRPTA